MFSEYTILSLFKIPANIKLPIPSMLAITSYQKDISLSLYPPFCIVTQNLTGKRCILAN